MGRVKTLLPEVRADALLALPDGALRGAGLSHRKVEYATELAQAIINGEFSPQQLLTLNDEAAIDRIVSLRGFGRWSAEIYLMFSMQRTDIFPADDLALQRALQRLKGLDFRPTPVCVRKIVAQWAPWRSVGSLFLWHYHRALPD